MSAPLCTAYCPIMDYTQMFYKRSIQLSHNEAPATSPAGNTHGALPALRAVVATRWLVLVQLGQNLVGEIHIGVDVLHIVGVFQGVDEAENLLGVIGL